MKCTSSFALASALLCITTALAAAQPSRPFTVDDLFSLQTLGETRISPDGTSLATVIQRAFFDPETFRPYDMFGNDQADIWMMAAAGGPPRNITRGAREAAGFWAPVWSPDSQRLALLSTAGGDNVRVYLWERQSGRMERISERGVDLGVGTEPARFAYGAPVQWVDDHRLLVAVLPPGEQPLPFRMRRQTQRIASGAWTKAARGREASASVLEAGIPPGHERPGELLLIDVVSRRVQRLAEGNIKRVFVSPDRKHVAVITQARRPPPVPGKLLGPVDLAPSRLGIASLQGESAVRWVEEVKSPAVEFARQPHRWSPRGSALAVLAPDPGQPESPQGVFLVSTTDLRVRKAAPNLVPTALAWSEDEQLIVRAATPGQAGRSDWWIIGRSEEAPRNLTSTLATVPAELVRTSRANEMIGLADGVLWRFDLAEGRPRHLIETPIPPVTAIVWPADRPVSLKSMVVRVADGGVSSLLQVDLSASQAKTSKFPQPGRATALAGYDLNRNLAVFTAPRDPDGTFVWTGQGGNAAFSQRMALNLRLREIAGGERMLIDYRSTDGQDLKAILLLPAGYQKGARYPLVTWVYPMTMIKDIEDLEFWITKNQAHQDNLHILAGAGYAVLIPSMPARNARAISEYAASVLPAIDRVVALGFADEHVAVMGQSFGGYATYGLITQTNRFKAAVAISGPANNITSYGTFSGQVRYTNDIDEILVTGSAGSFGKPPWSDPDVYVRNSPITFMDRVQTPLLILHGDIDFVPIQQAEEVYTSLARQGKRVRFIRYLGESHGASDSAANLRDRWGQILRWFDTYLRDASDWCGLFGKVLVNRSMLRPFGAHLAGRRVDFDS